MELRLWGLGSHQLSDYTKINLSSTTFYSFFKIIYLVIYISLHLKVRMNYYI